MGFRVLLALGLTASIILNSQSASGAGPSLKCGESSHTELRTPSEASFVRPAECLGNEDSSCQKNCERQAALDEIEDLARDGLREFDPTCPAECKSYAHISLLEPAVTQSDSGQQVSYEPCQWKCSCSRIRTVRRGCEASEKKKPDTRVSEPPPPPCEQRDLDEIRDTIFAPLLDQPTRFLDLPENQLVLRPSPLQPLIRRRWGLSEPVKNGEYQSSMETYTSHSDPLGVFPNLPRCAEVGLFVATEGPVGASEQDLHRTVGVALVLTFPGRRSLFGR